MISNIKHFKITEVGITIGDHLESVPVEPQEEMADGLDSLDLVVDSFWHMFSFAFGTCYPFMTNKATESALLKHAFLKDFMDDLMFRWYDTYVHGHMLMYPINKYV